MEIKNRIVRRPEAVQITGLSWSTIWRLEKAGKFPARIKLSERACGFRLGDLMEWVESREQANAEA